MKNIKIDTIDIGLEVLRGFWMSASTEREKGEYMEKINKALDQRLVEMKGLNEN